MNSNTDPAAAMAMAYYEALSEADKRKVDAAVNDVMIKLLPLKEEAFLVLGIVSEKLQEVLG